MGSSILTNTAAMTALQNLAMTQKSLNQVQNEVSSGLSVANASDNAAYWSISTSMNSDNSALGAVTNALNLGASVVSTASSAMSSVETILKQMKADIVTAQTAGTDSTQVQTDLTAQQQSLAAIIGSSSFNSVNLLDGTTTTTNIVTSFSRSSGSGDNTGLMAINTANIALAGGSTGGLLGSAAGLNGGTAGFTTTFTDSTGTSVQEGTYQAGSILSFSIAGLASTDSGLTKIATAIDAAISAVTSAGASLGSYTTTINNQLTYTSSLSDAITSGVGSLVDADMNTASTRLQALQTQQQLGVQSLSIANQNSQLILKLFGA